MNQEGNLSFALLFVAFFVAAIVLFALFIPMLLDINTQFYERARTFTEQAEDAANEIEDENTRTAILDSVQSADDAFQTNIDFFAMLIQYSWLIVGILLFLIVFVLVRQNVEVGQRFN